MPYIKIASSQVTQEQVLLSTILNMSESKEWLENSIPVLNEVLMFMHPEKRDRIKKMIQNQKEVFKYAGMKLYNYFGKHKGEPQRNKRYHIMYDILMDDLQKELGTSRLHFTQNNLVEITRSLYDVQVYEKEQKLSGVCRAKSLSILNQKYNPLPAMAGHDIGNNHKIINSLLALAEEYKDYDGYEVFEIDQAIRDLYAPMVETRMTLTEFWSKFDFQKNQVIQVTTNSLPRNQYPDKLRANNVTELCEPLQQLALEQKWDMSEVHIFPTAKKTNGFQCRVLPQNAIYSRIEEIPSIGNNWFKTEGVSEHLTVNVLYSSPFI